MVGIMKAWNRIGLEVLAVIFLAPQIFVILYHFRFLFNGGNILVLLKTLGLCGLTISWVSAPFLALLALLAHALFHAKTRWMLMLLFCVSTGYLWVTAWNLLVFDMFSYARAALPILLCSVSFAGYSAAHAFYQDSLLPPARPLKANGVGSKPTKNLASDLSE